MITTATFIPIVMALLSFTGASATTEPINYPAAISYVPQGDKPLTEPEMANLLERLTQSFVPLMSKDGKTRQCWGIRQKSSNSNGILVRAVDAYQFHKVLSSVLEVSNNSSLVVLDRWNVDFEKGATSTLDNKSTFLYDFDSVISGRFLYPGRDGRIHQVPLALEFVGRSDSVTSSLLPQHESGVGIFVNDAGKLLLIPLDESDNKINTANDLYRNFTQIVNVFLLRGRGLSVDPLSNIDSIAIRVYDYYDATSFVNSPVISSVKSELRKSCPRLVIATDSMRDIPLSIQLNGYRPRSSVDRQAVANVLGNYSPLLIPWLIVEYRRKTDGTFLLKLEIQAHVESNAGSTIATLYNDCAFGFIGSKSIFPTGALNALIKDFAAKWEKANPIENQRGSSTKP